MSTASAFDMDDFFSSNELENWRRVLGPGMHYHFGLFRKAMPDGVSDAEMEAGLERAVRLLYRHIPQGASVFDVGCGWGGAASMLVQEHGCRVHGITISSSQAAYCRGRGIDVSLADAEASATVFPEKVDVAFLLESLSHIRDKETLLCRLRRCSDTLVLRTHCSLQPIDDAFGGSMSMMPRGDLEKMITRAGWRVRQSVDRRIESMPTVQGWRERLKCLPEECVTGQLQVLKKLCAEMTERPQFWARWHPLVEIIAD